MKTLCIIIGLVTLCACGGPDPTAPVPESAVVCSDGDTTQVCQETGSVTLEVVVITVTR